MRLQLFQNIYQLSQFSARQRWSLAGVAILTCIWWLLSLSFNELVIASPVQTIWGLLQLLVTKDFWLHFGITLQRFLISLLLGSLLGLVFGVAAGLEKRVQWLLEPLHWVLMTMPPVVMVMVSMIWFGMGSVQTIFVTTMLVFPVIYANTVAGIESIDPGLADMAQVYGAGRWQQLRDLYLPGIAGPLFAGLTLSAGMGVRIVVLAEVLGAYNGIGYAFSLARTNIDTPALFAWIMVCLLLGGGLDGLLFSPLKNHVERWKKEQ